MAAESQGNELNSWLIEPPEEGEVRLYVAIGEDVGATAQFREALEALLARFQSSDVEGYGSCFPKCVDLNNCAQLTCSPLNNCKTLQRYPCAVRLDCQIKKVY